MYSEVSHQAVFPGKPRPAFVAFKLPFSLRFLFEFDGVDFFLCVGEEVTRETSFKAQHFLAYLAFELLHLANAFQFDVARLQGDLFFAYNV